MKGILKVVNIIDLVNRFKRGTLVLLAIVLSFAPLFVAPAVRAQEEAGGSGLSVSPTRTELSILPGERDTVTISLRNITSGPIVAEVFIDDFEPDNLTGEPRLVTDGNKNAASISGFVTAGQSVRLEPDQSKDVTLNVSIPNNAAPGGYYGAVRFKAVPANDVGSDQPTNEVSLTANVLSLVLIEVQGDITQKFAVNSVRAFLDDKAGSIFTRKPNFVGIEVENLGNSFVKPFGTVNVTNFTGKQVFSYEMNDSNPRSNVLPNSKRLYKDELQNVEKKIINGAEDSTKTSPITMPGRYKITANISYGNGGEVFTVTASFWYLPSWFILILAVIVLALVGLGFFLYRKYATKSTRRR